MCPDGRRTSLRFREDEDLPPTAASDPHRPEASHFAVYFDAPKQSRGSVDGELALTTLAFGERYGYIDHGDIEVHLTSNDFSTSDAVPGIDLQAVLTHEVGHYIGLAHSRVEGSIMASAYCQSAERCAEGKVNARRLGADDVAAVCALFPPEGQAGVVYEEPDAATCNMAPRSGSRAPRGALGILGAGILLGLVARRARRLLVSPGR